MTQALRIILTHIASDARLVACLLALVGTLAAGLPAVDASRAHEEAIGTAEASDARAQTANDHVVSSPFGDTGRAVRGVDILIASERIPERKPHGDHVGAEPSHLLRVRWQHTCQVRSGGSVELAAPTRPLFSLHSALLI